jgi:hypothetical protein
MQAVLKDPQAFDQLMQIYFFGVFRRKKENVTRKNKKLEKEFGIR